MRFTTAFVSDYVIIILGTWMATIASSMIDLWTGIEKAKALGDDISSSALRWTLVKIGDYWRVQVFGLIFDAFGSLYYDTPFASLLVGAGVLLIEFRSVIENLKEKKSAASKIVDAMGDVVDALKEKKVPLPKRRGEAKEEDDEEEA